MALARAAITEPRVLLLDEPLSALDEQLRVQMRQELRRMQRELGITFVHVTHTQLEAIALADHRGGDGERQDQASRARRATSTPIRSDRYVAEFLGGQNVLSAARSQTVDGHACRGVAARPAAASPVPARRRRPRIDVGDRIDLAVRRDDVELVRADAGGPARRRNGAAEPGDRDRISGLRSSRSCSTPAAMRTLSPTSRSGYSSAIPLRCRRRPCSPPGRSRPRPRSRLH